MKVTLGELKTIIRDLTDTTGSDAILDSSLTWHINEELGEIYSLLAEAYQDYFIKQGTLVIASGVSGVYQLPSDFWKLDGLWYLDSEGDYWPLKRYNKYLWDLYKNSDITTNEELLYRLQNSSIKFHTTPPESTGSFLIDYIPGYQKLASDTDEISWQVPFNWVSYVINGVAAKVYMKLEFDPTLFMAEKNRLKNEIKEVIRHSDRDSYPDQVVDIYRRWDE